MHNRALLDLDYAEDSLTQVDMNLTVRGNGQYVELQASNKGRGFSSPQP